MEGELTLIVELRSAQPDFMRTGKRLKGDQCMRSWLDEFVKRE